MPTLAVGIVLLSTFVHAGWNLLLRSNRTTYTFLRAMLVIAVVGLVPAIAVEFLGAPFPRPVWGFLAAAGVFQALYYLGLSKGYLSGDFTVVYPVVRVLPIMLVAVIDVALGKPLSGAGWLGILLVSAGCLVMPLKSLRAVRLSDYWNPSLLWVLVAALGTAGYTAVDHEAAGMLQPGPWAAVRYEVFEATLSAVAYFPLLRALRQPDTSKPGWAGWKVPIVVGVGVFVAYALVLWAYQLSPQASYVVALRQLSIVIGVIVGAFLFREPAPGLRIGATVVVAVGIACVALGG